MKLLFPLRVEAGRVIVDRDGNVVATVLARRRLETAGPAYYETSISPADADENAHEIVKLLNAAVGT